MQIPPIKAVVLMGKYEVTSAFVLDEAETTILRRVDEPGDNVPWKSIESRLNNPALHGTFRRGDVWGLALVRIGTHTNPAERPKLEVTPMIRAKFQVCGVEQQGGNEVVSLTAATEGAENKSWSDATPSGHMVISISNPAAQGQLIAGQAYYLDFTPVEAPSAEGEDVGTATGDERTE